MVFQGFPTFFHGFAMFFPGFPRFSHIFSSTPRAALAPGRRQLLHLQLPAAGARPRRGFGIWRLAKSNQNNSEIYSWNDN